MKALTSIKSSLLWTLTSLLLLAPLGSAQEAAESSAEPAAESSDYAESTASKGTRKRMAPWPSEVLEAAALIPVQEGGRTKPLGSMAGFMMLSINGKQTFTTEWGEKLDPVAWFLDCLLFPDQAMAYRTIRVVDYRIIESIGLKRRTTKRSDYYSMLELLPGSERLELQTRTFAKKDSKARTMLENQILNLGHSMTRLLYLTSFLDFARAEFELSDMPELESVFPDTFYLNSLNILGELDALRARLSDETSEPSPGINTALGDIQQQLSAAGFINLIPPTRKEVEEYLSPMNVIEVALLEGTPMPVEMAVVERLPQLVTDRLDMDKLGAGIISLQGELKRLAEERGEYSKVAQEVAFYEMDWFFKSMLAFWAAFLFCLASWFFTKKSMPWKLSYAGGLGFVLLGEGLLIGGIVARCLLKDRPPITTVYEAVLFIFAAIVLMALFMEFIKRNSMSLAMAAVIGALGMHLGMWNLKEDGSDSIAPLVAVLDTNFWLSIHVPTVTLGYAAGILAAFLGHVFVFGKVYDIIRRSTNKQGLNKRFFSELTRMTYGVLCFGALTATVGTILGGVWANDSWGRFWGWDPKENGALMLCLGYVLILHGRMGGYLRQFGIALCSIMLGNVVLWAFWGVNLLQVGLHSYGFDATKALVTNYYYLIEWGFVAFGVMVWLADRAVPKSKLVR